MQYLNIVSSTGRAASCPLIHSLIGSTGNTNLVSRAAHSTRYANVPSWTCGGRQRVFSSNDSKAIRTCGGQSTGDSPWICLFRVPHFTSLDEVLSGVESYISSLNLARRSSSENLRIASPDNELGTEFDTNGQRGVSSDGSDAVHQTVIKQDDETFSAEYDNADHASNETSDMDSPNLDFQHDSVEDYSLTVEKQHGFSQNDSDGKLVGPACSAPDDVEKGQSYEMANCQKVLEARVMLNRYGPFQYQFFMIACVSAYLRSSQNSACYAYSLVCSHPSVLENERCVVAHVPYLFVHTFVANSSKEQIGWYLRLPTASLANNVVSYSQTSDMEMLIGCRKVSLTLFDPNTCLYKYRRTWSDAVGLGINNATLRADNVSAGLSELDLRRIFRRFGLANERSFSSQSFAFVTSVQKIKRKGQNANVGVSYFLRFSSASAARGAIMEMQRAAVDGKQILLTQYPNQLL